MLLHRSYIVQYEKRGGGGGLFQEQRKENTGKSNVYIPIRKLFLLLKLTVLTMHKLTIFATAIS